MRSHMSDPDEADSHIMTAADFESALASHPSEVEFKNFNEIEDEFHELNNWVM